MFITLKKIKNLIDQKLKINLFFYFFISLFLVILEFLGLAIIYPIIDIVFVKKSLPLNYFFLKSDEFLYILLFVFAAIMISKNFLYIYLNYWQYKFVGKVQVALSRKLLRNYLIMPYKRHLDISSSILIKNIDEAQTFSSYLFALLNLLVEILIVIVIFVLLLKVSFYFTVAALLLIAGISLLFYYSTKFRLVKWAKKRIFLSRKTLKELIETFKSIREIKKYSKEKQFLSQNIENLTQTIDVSIKTNVLKLLPKSFYEICLVVLVVGIIMYLSFYSIDSQNILPTLTVFIAASIRLIPSGTKIMHQYQTIRMGKLSVEIISNELNKKIEIDKKKLVNNFKLSTLEFKHVDFNYGEKKIFENLNMKFEKNKVYGIIGKSGAGKTTLVNLILNLIIPDKGKIIINNSIDLNEIKNNFQSFVPQKIYLLDNTIKFNITFEHNDNNIDFKKLDYSLKKSKLYSFTQNLKNGVNEVIGEDAIKISGGQLQRLAIARALYHNSQLIIFDEPTSSLDSINEDNIFDSIYSLRDNRIVIIISHSDKIKKFTDDIIDISNIYNENK